MRKAIPICLGALLTACMLTACFEPVRDTHPDQVLTKRVALFKQFTRALEPIGLVVSGRKDYQKDEFLVLAQDLEKLSGKPWAYFPADGNYPPTHARPVVWSHPAEFKAAQEKFQAAVKQLAADAQAGDLEKIKVSVWQVTESCKSCHRQFRFD